jgi:tryprostatin B 6-hydroxylase
VRPHEFIPERWTTRPELVLDKRAFFPFHMGKS